MRPTVSPEVKMYPSGLNSASACPQGVPTRLAPPAPESREVAQDGWHWAESIALPALGLFAALPDRRRKAVREWPARASSGSESRGREKGRDHGSQAGSAGAVERQLPHREVQ